MSIGQTITQASRPSSSIAPIPFGICVDLDKSFATRWFVDHLAKFGFSVSSGEVKLFKESAIASLTRDNEMPEDPASNQDPPEYPAATQSSLANPPITQSPPEDPIAIQKRSEAIPATEPQPDTPQATQLPPENPHTTHLQPEDQQAIQPSPENQTAANSEANQSKKTLDQFSADNADHNIRTLTGKGTFHGMGIIKISTNKTSKHRAIKQLKHGSQSNLSGSSIPIFDLYGSSFNGFIGA